MAHGRWNVSTLNNSNVHGCVLYSVLYLSGLSVHHANSYLYVSGQCVDDGAGANALPRRGRD
jgi:hypothetical protein